MRQACRQRRTRPRLAIRTSDSALPTSSVEDAALPHVEMNHDWRSSCALSACGAFETSISSADRKLILTNLVLDF